MIDLATLERHFPDGERVELTYGTLVSHIHKKVEYIHWLLEGSVCFFVALREGDLEIEVCQFTGEILPIGWSGLNPPGRHTKNIFVASQQAVFFRVALRTHQTFLHTLADQALHIHVCKKQFLLLKQAVLNQQRILPANNAVSGSDTRTIQQDMPSGLATDQQTHAVMSLLKSSPFFEFFEDDELLLIAKGAIRREYRPNDIVFQQDTLSDGLYMHIEGDIRMERVEGEQRLSQWPIANHGFIYGWACMIGEKEICTAQVVRRTYAYFIEREHLHRLLKANPDFALRFFTRLNWLVDNHINAAFIRFLSLQFNANQLAIQYLIESYQTQIKISSKLHQIPHLLKHRTTKSLAFDILQQLTATGTSRERRISSICLDVLDAEKQEILFLEQLQNVYEVVTGAHPEQDVVATRKACSNAVRKLCTFFDYQIKGWNYLPEQPGHIFIYNHLINHPDYVLNNNFQITLESHFISAMILDEKYGDPGVRTVRIGRSREFAHQDYYEKLGYINVFTKESDNTGADQRQEARDRFFQTAKDFLRRGHNIIISPEGTSYRTEDDIPGEFKPGAFRLALETVPEPMIVPIVMLNFDKRIHESEKYCQILQPFRISSHPLFDKGKGVADFVKKYQQAFKKELEEAKRLLGIQYASDYRSSSETKHHT